MVLREGRQGKGVWENRGREAGDKWAGGAVGVLKTWEVGEIKGNPQSQSKKGLKVEVKKKGGRGQKNKVLDAWGVISPPPPLPHFFPIYSLYDSVFVKSQSFQIGQNW